MSLSKADIDKVEDRPLKKLHVPEWAGDVYIRTLSGLEADLFERDVYGDDKKGSRNVRARLAVTVLADEQGNRLYTDADAGRLGKEKSRAALDRIFEAARLHNRMGAEHKEELAGNSAAGPADDSPSDSPKK